MPFQKAGSSDGYFRFCVSDFGVSHFDVSDSGVSHFGVSDFGVSHFGVSYVGVSAAASHEPGRPVGNDLSTCQQTTRSDQPIAPAHRSVHLVMKHNVLLIGPLG
jgi:hypothetical protein